MWRFAAMLSAALCLWAGVFEQAHAASFAAVASPPRFELTGKAGETLREALEISNADAQAGKYKLRTADWRLEPNGGPSFQDDLQPGSCRPWVALERRNVSLAPRANRKLRFEVQIPAGAPDGECRFALMIEHDEEQLPLAMAGDLPVPVQGRIAVIVYVQVGNAKPNLSLQGIVLKPISGKSTPVAIVKNEGNAHDRLEGVLQAVDANKQSINFSISSLPILPGETRELPFSAIVFEQSDKPPESWTLPLKLTGPLGSQAGAKFKVDQILP